MKNIEILEYLADRAINVDPVGNQKVMAGLVFRGRILESRSNMMKSSPFQLRFAKNPDSIFFHAETHTIRAALNRIRPDIIEKCVMYVCRVSKNNGEWRMARPCRGCYMALDTFGISKVVYTTVDGYRVLNI